MRASGLVVATGFVLFGVVVANAKPPEARPVRRGSELELEFLRKRVELLTERVELHEELGRIGRHEAEARLRRLEGEQSVREARLQASQVTLKLGEADLRRLEKLHEAATISQSELAAARRRFEVARLTHAEAREALDALKAERQELEGRAARERVESRLGGINARLELLEAKYRLELKERFLERLRDARRPDRDVPARDADRDQLDRDQLDRDRPDRDRPDRDRRDRTESDRPEPEFDAPGRDESVSDADADAPSE